MGFIANFDFASLYPSTMTMVFGKMMTRKSKIKRMFR